MSSSDVLSAFQSQLLEIERLTQCLSADAPFKRIEDQDGEIVSTLVPSERQRLAAYAHGERLQRWLSGVTALLRRRGGSASAHVESLVEDWKDFVLLTRTDIADVTETQWRAAFAHGASAIRLQIAQVLDECADAFAVRERRRPRRMEAFHVTVVELGSGLWRVDASSSSGTATETILLLPDMIDAMRIGRKFISARIDLAALIDLGRTLFQRMFTASVATLFFDSHEDAVAHRSALCLQMHLGDAGPLATLPWEMLHDGERFLSLAATSPIVRLGGRRARPVTKHGIRVPLRVLLTTSSPKSFLHIGGEEERVSASLAALVALEQLQMDVTSDGTMNALRRSLRAADDTQRPYDIWHFGGHGRRDEATGRSELLMTAADGSIHTLGVPQIHTLFGDHPDLRLVVLNACEGAMDEWLTGIASAFLETGVEAVVAMQLPIGGKTAGIFAEEFYGALADGSPIELALTEARRGIYFRGNAVEWVTPVLFLRDGTVSIS